MIDPTYFYSNTAPTNTVGDLVSFNAADSGVSSLTYSAPSGLPPGLSITSTGTYAGLITGTIPTQAGAVGTWSVEIKGTNGTDDYFWSFNWVISPANLTITADDQSFTYRDSVPTLTATYSGFVDGDDASALTTPLSLSTYAVSTSPVSGSPYTIYASGAVDPDYSITMNNGSMTVNPIALTLSATADDKTYDGTTTATPNFDTSGINGGDSVSFAYSSADFSDKDVGTGKSVSITGVSLTGADASDYTLDTSSTSATADITPLALGVSATAQNKIYDATTTATLSSLTLSGVIYGDSVSVSNTGADFSDANVAAGKTVTVTGISLSGTDAGNYTVSSSTTTTADITQASTSTSLTSDTNPSFLGDDVTFTATVTNTSTSPVPDGYVDFLDDGDLIGDGALDGSGIATFSTSTLIVGDHPITAEYLGTTDFTTSSSSSLAQLVWDVPGNASVSANILDTGAYTAGIPLDLDQSPGRDVGSDPGLLYNSATADPRPVVQAEVSVDPGSGTPTSISIDVTWDGTDLGANILDPSDLDLRP